MTLSEVWQKSNNAQWAFRPASLLVVIRKDGRRPQGCRWRKAFCFLLVNQCKPMAEKLNKKLAVARIDYAYYRKEQLDKFKATLTSQELDDLRTASKAEFIFDSWLEDKGVVPVSSFEQWRKS